jgi:predicted PurR-regulated permease PerM
MGVFLLIWAVIVSSIDNVIKPLLISRGSNMPFVLILIGVLGGAIAFGLIGVFIGPTLMAVAYKLIDAWSRSGSPDAGVGQ